MHDDRNNLSLESPLTRRLGMGVLAVSVGNTNTAMAIMDRAAPVPPIRFSNTDLDAMAARLLELDTKLDDMQAEGAVVIASVNNTVRDALLDRVRPELKHEIYRVGVDMPIPVKHTLTDEAIAKTGQDRLLNALAAHALMRQACVIVDVGTATTVDFIDGEGTFHGGAIAPGPRLALWALNSRAPALPQLELEAPADEPFAPNTKQAMLQGAVHGTRGLVRLLTERYAEAYEAFPQVVVTGGDAEMIFGGDETVDRIVSGLTLLGVALSCQKALSDDGEDAGDES